MAFSSAGGGPFSTGPKMWDHLRERLRDIFAIRVERIAYVEADDDIDFQDVADVIAIARIAGVDRVGLLTEDGKQVPMAG